MSESVDFTVIGAGILGLGVARELRSQRPGAKIVVVDREAAVAAHQSSHNSGVIHAGVYYRPGSMKARMCVAGARLMYEFCERHGIQAVPAGKLIIAARPVELAALEELERRGQANGVPGLRRLRAEEIAEVEPYATGLAALHSPRTGVVDYSAVCRAMAAELNARDVELRLGWPVHEAARRGPGLCLQGPGGASLQTRFAIACAGLWSDRLARAAGAPEDPRIVPFRGGYLRLRPERRHLVRGLIYPVPDPALPFLGVHLTRTASSDVLAGPTALLAPSRTAYRLGSLIPGDLASTLAWPGTWRMAKRWWRTGIREMAMAARPATFASQAAAYVPELGPGDFEPAGAGIRAQAVARDGSLVDDFVLHRTPRMLHVRNAPSPAATSSLALAAHIVGEVLREG